MPSSFELARAVLSAGFVSSMFACSPADIPAPDGNGTADAATTDAAAAYDATVSPSDAAPATDASNAIDAACTAYGYARCNKLSTCSLSLLENHFGNFATCEAIYAAMCEGSLRSPSTGTTVASYAACSATITSNSPSWACSDYVQYQNVPPACVTPPGGLANGAPCTASEQCASAACRIATGSVCGVCAPHPLAGDSCTDASCGGGGNLICEPVDGGKICSTYALLGEPCAPPATPCATALQCVSGSSGATCEASVATLGAPCVYSGVGCDFAAGLTCDFATAKCVTAHLAMTGQACGMVGTQNVACLGGNCNRGACVAAALPGQACDSARGPSCVTSSTCVASVDGGTAGVCAVQNSGTCP